MSAKTIADIAGDPCVTKYKTRRIAVRALDTTETDFRMCRVHQAEADRDESARRAYYAAKDAAYFEAERREDEAAEAARAAAEEAREVEQTRACYAAKDAEQAAEEARAVAEQQARYEANAAAVRASLRVGDLLRVPQDSGASTRALVIVSLDADTVLCRTPGGAERRYRYDGRRAAD